MCGIAGIIQNNKEREITDNTDTVNEMLSVLEKRGPDEFWCYIF